MDLTDLRSSLTMVDQLFDIKKLTNAAIDKDDIVDYYTQSDYGYRVFHSLDGSIHMALNFDGVFSEEGYYGQANLVNQFITEMKASRVLELAAGKGFNSIFLAKKNGDIQFSGIDLTPLHVKVAKSSADGIPNVNFELGDFQNLPFAAETFDLVFVVESLCHASDMPQALAEARRVLKPGGQLVVFDGFRKEGFTGMEKEVQTASRLVEVAMAVGNAWEIDDWTSLAEKQGFAVMQADDISAAIMPNLLKFQQLARRFFKHRILNKIITFILPSYLVKNSIAGLLMPITVKLKAQGYYMVRLKRD